MSKRSVLVIVIACLGAGGLGALALLEITQLKADAAQTRIELQQRELEFEARMQALEEEKRRAEDRLYRLKREYAEALRKAEVRRNVTPAGYDPEADWLCDRVPCNQGDRIPSPTRPTLLDNAPTDRRLPKRRPY